MIKWKALQWALALFCCFYWLFNPALAQETYEDPAMTGTYEDPAMTETYEPKYVYSPENPFATSEYTDIADIAEDWLRLGGNIDQYFYSEGFTTGTDGTLGNEYLCIRDDFNRVYFGRSDVCVNRAAADYDYIHFDKVDTNRFDSLAQIKNSMLDPDQTYQTGDLLGDTSKYWSGCYTINEGWAGTSGGQCPTINDQYGGQINYGYIEQTLTNTAAIDLALKNAGLETTGYTYSWLVKNADANQESTNNPYSVDPFQVTVSVYDDKKNIVFEKTYDYSYWIDQWTQFSGTETFDTPFNIDELSAISLSITGQDIGYWAGYYGPEFKQADIRLNYRVAQPTGPSPEEILKEQICISDPTSDPTCPGYNDAMMAQIASTNTIDDINSGVNIGAQSTINDGSTGLFDEATGAETQVAETAGAVIDDGSDNGADVGSDNGMPDPVAEATGDPVKEAVAEAAGEPVEDAADQTTAEATGETKEGSTGLNATQLSAVNAANNVANSAVSTSTDAAQASTGIGLSESGGVSSTLTSVDPTGSTSADGGIAGGSDFDFSSNTSTTQDFGNTQDSATTQGSNNGSTQNNTSDSTQTNSTSDFASNEQSGSQNSDSSETGGVVETSDITGDDALATSNESLVQLSMLNDPANPINQIINEITANLITKAANDAEEVAEESAEESVESQNEKEDALVAEALSGSDNEDAQAALLGYNPNFRAYQQEQIYVGDDIYSDQGVYENQKTYDSPRAGLFNGASDATHRAMVRQQYNLGN